MPGMEGHAPSWYAATAHALPLQPPLRGTVTADVAIVGAGYTGLSAALHLAVRGFKVVVVERGRIAGGASGRNGGQIHSGQRRDQEFLEQAVGPADARRLWDLAEEAKTLVRDLIARHAIACDYRPASSTRTTRPAMWPTATLMSATYGTPTAMARWSRWTVSRSARYRLTGLSRRRHRSRRRPSPSPQLRPRPCPRGAGGGCPSSTRTPPPPVSRRMAG